MDERYRKKGIWIGVGALAIIFLCVMLCGLGAIVMLATRSGPVYGVVPQVQPPVGEEGAAPPQVYHYGYSPVGVGRHIGFDPFSFLFKLLFFGLLLLLLMGLIRRIFWGPRYWGYRYWHPPQGRKPPKGKQDEDNAQSEWGPWAWHHRRKHWGPPPWWGPEPEQTDEEGKPDETDLEYSGPQE